MKKEYRFQGKHVRGLAIGVCLLLLAGCTAKRSRSHGDLIRYGVTLAEAGYWREAAMQWQLVLVDDPDNVAALNNLGVASEAAEEFELAEKYLIRALELRSRDKRLINNSQALQSRLVSQKYRGDDPE